MSRILDTISGRLSLRPPQRASLKILERVCEVANPTKDTDLVAALDVIKSEYPSVTAFERDFPSLCFALATGVGKTRLMGAFIAYLYLMRRSRHFFVLAPNLTIYNKLIADFTPGTPKYVFQGISEFVTAPPVVITGDTYESGIGVREDARLQMGLFRVGGEDPVHINVFNISKINKDVRSATRKKGTPRIKRLSEYIGQSYFDYLAGLPDLVILMDEAHRYRADAGMSAINELKPILGLELTATPFTEGKGKQGPIAFSNAVYSYSLAEAIVDGFVKEPAVATRKDFDATKFDEARLERIKLDDGVRLHEKVKADLQIYASDTGKPYVKPFMLVIARDTKHAAKLVELFKSDDFFEGNYADKVIEVHSALKGDEKEETVERLLAVEDPNEPTEIVIHVNMLKEGWDVTNLYTIVPLRAANARTLIEQSIGRGLRLPFGRRTGVKAVDRLTIVAHDKFQEIVDEANRGDCIIRRIDTIILDADGAEDAPVPVVVKPVIDGILGGDDTVDVPGIGPAPTTPPLPGTTPTPTVTKPMFATPTEKAVAKATLAVITKKTTLTAASTLLTPEQQKKIVEEVKAIIPQQAVLPCVELAVEAIVKKATKAYVDLSIDIPTITVVPTGEVSIVFANFDLDTAMLPAFQPVEQDILVRHLRTHEQEQLSVVGGGVHEKRLEDFVVSALISFDDVDYDATADLLYKLAGEYVVHLNGYLADEDAVRNVLVYHQPQIGGLVHAQMVKHRREKATGYEVKVLSGHRPLKPATLAVKPSESVRNFRVPIDQKSRIKQMVFGGFGKCLYPLQKFDSDSERRLAMLLESDGTVEKWVKPGKGNFQIALKGGKLYEPDFVVEAEHGRYLCEVKRSDFVKEDEVLAKADAASVWCQHATEYAVTDDKPWRYLLIPADSIKSNLSLDWLAKMYEHKATVPTTVVPPREESNVLPFRRVEASKVKPFENAIPLYDLKVAAGRFSEEQVVDAVPQQGEVQNPDDYEWVNHEGRSKPTRGLFVAQVVGESMNKRIPNGAWCVWNLEHGADGQGEIVLARHSEIHDDELGQFTVKVYLRELLGEDDAVRVTLRPSSTDPKFKEPIALEGLAEGDLRIVAEFVEVLR